MNAKTIKESQADSTRAIGSRILLNPTSSKSLVLRTMQKHGLRIPVTHKSQLGEFLGTGTDTSCTALIAFDLDASKLVVLIKVARQPEIHAIDADWADVDGTLTKRLAADCTKFGLVVDCKCPTAVFAPRTRISRALIASVQSRLVRAAKSGTSKMQAAQASKEKAPKTERSTRSSRKAFRLNRVQDAIVVNAETAISLSNEEEARILDRGTMIIKTVEDAKAWVTQANYYSSKRIIYDDDNLLLSLFGSASATQLIGELAKTKIDLTGTALVKTKSTNQHITNLRDGNRKR